MRNAQRIADFVAEQGIVPPNKPPPLSAPPRPNFTTPNDRDTARDHLLHLRHHINGKKEPSKGFRAKIGLRNEADVKEINSTFSLQERRDVFDRLLQKREPVGVAQAVLEYHPSEELDINIRHVQIAQRFRKTHDGPGQNETASRWLQVAAETGQDDYVRLLAAYMPLQASLDESLKIAVKQRSVTMTTELLRYGANGDTCRREFSVFAAGGDVEWTTLLLNSTIRICQNVRDEAILEAVEQGNFDMANIMLSFDADANYDSGLPIISAIENSDFRMLTLLISTSTNLDQESLRRAMSCACTVSNVVTEFRSSAIEILLAAGAEITLSHLTPLLHEAVTGNDRAFLSLLVRYHQVPLEAATEALTWLSGNLLEDDAHKICRLLFKAGAGAQHLGALLYWAVDKDYDHLIKLLVDHEVSLDFQDAAAVRIALKHQNIELLKVLLRESSPVLKSAISDDRTLAGALPQALKISSRSKRHVAVNLLLQKGVAGPHVDAALLDVVIDPKITDIDLVQKLLAGGASVNFCKDDKNCILAAAEEGNLEILDRLSETKNGALCQIMSQAVLLVYQSRLKSSTSKVTDTLTKLLRRGADRYGDLVARTLLLAVQAAEDAESAVIAELVLQYGANVNYQGGESIKQAVKLKQDRILAAICMTKTINENSFAQTLPLAIEASREDQSKLDILLHACRDFQGVTSDSLISEVERQPSGGQDAIVRILLKNGADVNHREGFVFVKAIGIQSFSKSMNCLTVLLAQHPGQIALGSAFNAIRKLQGPLDRQYALYKAILEAGYEGNSMNSALLESIHVHKNDLTIPRLLLKHGASIDHKAGAALTLAVEHDNMEMTNTFIAYGPDKSTLNRAFTAAFQSNTTVSRQIEVFTCLLATKKISKDNIAHALTHSITHGNFDETLLSLLARRGPPVETEALLSLVARQNITTAQLLFKFKIPGEQARSLALRSCLNFETQIRLAFAKLLTVDGLESGVWTAALRTSIQEEDHDFLGILLGCRPDKGLEVGEALVFSMDTLNPVTVDVLLRHGPSAAEVNQAFERLLISGGMWSTTDSVAAATRLLQHGVSQSLKDRALVKSLKSHLREHTDFYKILIKHGADVNTDSCICFRLAGQSTDLDVFEYLLQSTPNFDSVVQSLVSDFPQTEYERVVKLVLVTFNCPKFHSERKDVSVIFEAMRRFGQEDGLIRLLLDHGYPAGQTMLVNDGVTLNTEAVTPVIWALGQPRPGVSDEVILELLNQGKQARPEFVTENSEITALSLAARSGRHDILERLLELPVDVSAVDAAGNSALFHAATGADSMSVYLLLEKGAQCNDGSLHEAARLCQKGIVALLLEKGHDPDFSSDLHGGRTALGELCSQAILQSGEQMSAAYECIKLFIHAPVNLNAKVSGKTVLHFALENDQPVEITKTLLRFPEIYNEISTDSEKFIYEDSHGRFMSPDIYTKRYCRHGDNLKSALVDLLMKKRCKVKWFTKKGDQLDDCKGLPPAIKEAMDMQDIADQAERRATQRRLASFRVELEIKQQQHQANMAHTKEQADLDLSNTKRVHEELITHEDVISTQRRQNDNAARADERWHIQEKNRLEYASEKQLKELEYTSRQQLSQLEYTSREQLGQLEYTTRERQGKMEYASRLQLDELERSSRNDQHQQRYTALKREAKLEQSLIESREAADKRAQSRAIDRFNRQDASVRLAAQEQRAMIAAAQGARLNGHYVSPLPITNEEVD